MSDSLHLREGQCTDRRFYYCNLTVFLCALLIYSPKHFQPHYSGSILTQDNIVYIVLGVALVNKQSSQTFPCDLYWSDDRLELFHIHMFKA